MIFFQQKSNAQGLHFSQFYNAPILLNPANTGIIKDGEWRAGGNYRTQWFTIPVPYNTSSVFVDFALMKNKWETSWIGLGGAFWRDVAGNGNLSLNKFQTNLSYHVMLNEKSTLSGGLGIAKSQRAIDISKLTFDAQWNEFTFDRSISNRENIGRNQTDFWDMSAGINFSSYNQENMAFKISLAAMHINRPLESFYGESNKMGVRPIANVEVIYKASNMMIITPSVYYTSQKKASELIFGSLFNLNVSGSKEMTLTPNEFIMGVHYRYKDAAIGSMGYRWNKYQLMMSYDHTLSKLNIANKGIGAFEFSFMAQGSMEKNDDTKMYSCPRF